MATGGAHSAAVTLALLALSPALCSSSPEQAPLIIKSQGSFFVGGETKSIAEPAAGVIPEQGGDITVNQMYVQYQVPVVTRRHSAVVMIHGCCLSGKTWETTPDGRMGWSEYFVRQGRAVYVVEQVSRARSGFDPSKFYSFGSGNSKAMPEIVDPSHQFAWSAFRLGPTFGVPFSDGQFPIKAVDEFYKQLIPELNSTLSEQGNETPNDLSLLAKRLKSAILMGHSQSGFFPQRAALLDRTGIAGIISIETPCETNLTHAEMITLARIPTLIVFGDHLDDVAVKLSAGSWTWGNALVACRRFAEQIKNAGGDVYIMHLPELGIRGNSHMLMQDANNKQIADLIIAWIDAHVESKTRTQSKGYLR